MRAAASNPAAPETQAARDLAKAHRRYQTRIARSERTRARARAEWRIAVRAALNTGLSLRETAAITGLDHTRIWQIAREGEKD